MWVLSRFQRFWQKVVERKCGIAMHSAFILKLPHFFLLFTKKIMIFINMWFSKFDVIAAVLTALWITHNTFHCVRHRVTNIRTTQQPERANQGLNVPNFPSLKYTPSRRQWIKSWPKYFTFNTMHIHPAFHGNVRYSRCNIIHQSAGIIPTR